MRFTSQDYELVNDLASLRSSNMRLLMCPQIKQKTSNKVAVRTSTSSHIVISVV